MCICTIISICEQTNWQIFWGGAFKTQVKLWNKPLPAESNPGPLHARDRPPHAEPLHYQRFSNPENCVNMKWLTPSESTCLGVMRPIWYLGARGPVRNCVRTCWADSWGLSAKAPKSKKAIFGSDSLSRPDSSQSGNHLKSITTDNKFEVLLKSHLCFCLWDSSNVFRTAKNRFYLLI